MRTVLAISIALVFQIQIAGATEALNQKIDSQAFECRDFSEVGFKDRGAFLNYLAQLKAAKSVEDFEKLVTYPLRVNRKPKALVIKDQIAFKKNFKEIFSDKVVEAIKNSEQKDNFCNDQGMSVANGTIWINKKSDRTGIYVVNE